MRLCIWVVDCLDKQSLNALKSALKKAANITQLSMVPVEDVCVGLCYVRMNSESAIELKFVLKPDRVRLSSFHKGVDHLQPSEKTSGQQQLAAVLKKVIERLESGIKECIPSSGRSGTDTEILKEIHVVSKALEPGAAIQKLLRIASKRDVHIRFHAFIDDTSMGGSLDDGGRSVELMHEQFSKDVSEMENVSFNSTVSSDILIDQMMMSWIRDLLPNTSVQFSLVFPATSSSTCLKFPCVASNMCLKLRASFSKARVCSCHHESIQSAEHKCSVSNAILEKGDHKEARSLIQLGEDVLKLPSDTGACQMEIIQERSEDIPILSIMHRLPLHQLRRQHLGSGVQIFYDMMEDEDDKQRDFFGDLCRASAESGEAFVAKGPIDLEAGLRCHIPQHYALLAAQDGSMLHAFRMTTSDELLPGSSLLKMSTESTAQRIQAAKEILKQMPLESTADPFSLSSDAHALLSQLISDSVPTKRLVHSNG